MNHAGSVLSDAAHSFSAELAGGEDAPNQERSRTDLCCHPFPQPWKSRAGCHYSILVDDASSCKGGGGALTPSSPLIAPGDGPVLPGGLYPPFHPIAAAPCPHGGWQQGFRLEGQAGRAARTVGSRLC